MAYPASVTTFASRSNGQAIDASHINDLQTEVNAIEDALLTTGLAHHLFPDATTRTLGTSSKPWGDMYLAATKLFYLDSGVNTYLTESSGDVVDVVTGATVRARFGASTVPLRLGPAVTLVSGGAITSGLQMSASNLGIFVGSGAPTLSAVQGSLYLRSDGSSTTTRAYINTDSGTTWTAITTAA